MILQLPEVTTADIYKNFVDQFLTGKVKEYNKWNDYYEGRHAILSKVKDEGEANTKLIFQYPRLIIDTAHSYLVGKPITYANNIELDDEEYNDTEEFLKRLTKLFVSIDEGFHTAELLKNTSICGDGYEYVYLSKITGLPKVVEFPATECMPIYSPATKELEKIIRVYQMEELLANNTVNKYYNVEVYGSEKIEYYVYKDGLFKADLSRPDFYHLLGEVPVVHYRNTKVATNDYGMSDLLSVVTLIDEYEERASELSNTLQYNGNPIMRLINCVMDDDQYKEMIQKRVMQIPEGGQADYLVWDQQIGAIEKHLERLQDAILTFSSTPKLYKDNDDGNPMSGISIKMKFSGADLKANDKERNYKQGIRKRLRLLAKIWNLTDNKSYNSDDIDILFNRSIPQNLTEIADMVVSLKGTVSDETLLGLLPFVVDVQTELQTLAREQKEKATTTEVTDQTDLSNTDTNNQDDGEDTNTTDEVK